MTPSEVPAGAPLLSIDGQLARIVLRRPEQHNALEAGDVADLRSHLDKVDADGSVRVLVLTGSGDATFCSGASLRDIESGELTPAMFEALTDRVASVRTLTICALNGSVYGGGTELALSCDFRVGVFGSRMAVPAARLGMSYPLEGLRRYVHALGLPVTRRVMLAGDALQADEMLRVGFLDRLVSPEELEGSVDELARDLAAMAPLAVQAMKRILADLSSGRLDEERARELTARASASEDLREGLRARREGRTPEFRGR